MSQKQFIKYSQKEPPKKLQMLARHLRKNSTLAERIVWNYLKQKKLGYTFRRQYNINDKYIVDFVCLKKKLIIELDGESHLNKQEKDNLRTQYLEQQGFTVIRFVNASFYNEESAENCFKKIKDLLVEL
jgi:very-short-patch-repair endonuclease